MKAMFDWQINGYSFHTASTYVRSKRKKPEQSSGHKKSRIAARAAILHREIPKSQVIRGKN
jgi:hypothetical protein